jgi:hypothetical protein
MLAGKTQIEKRKNINNSSCEKKLKISNDATKIHRKITLTLEKKIELLNEWNQGKSNWNKSALGRKFGIKESTVRSIIKQERRAAKSL